MGKLKRGKRNQNKRHNPISRDSKDLKKDESTRQSKIVPLINKLRSTTPNDKSMALGAITVLADDKRMRQLLLKERLIPTILETCLNDSNDEIIVESFGLLRNLSIEEGYDVIKYLWRNGIWITIEDSLNKINESFKVLNENKITDKSKLHLLYDFTENILSLIIVLASGSEDIYDSIFEKIDPIIEFILKLTESYLDGKNIISKRLFNSLLEFIYEFSTESVEFIQKLEQFNWDRLIEFVNENGSSLTKIYIEGIKFNNYEILETDHTNKQQFSTMRLNQIYTILGSINLQQLQKDLHLINNPNNAENPIQQDSSTIEKDLSSSINELKSKTKNDLTAIETGLDIITQIIEYLSVNEDESELQLQEDIKKVLLDEIDVMLVELLKFDMSNNIIKLNEKVLTCLSNLIWLLFLNQTLPVAWYEKSTEILQIILNMNDEKLQKSTLSILWGLIKTLGPEILSKLPDQLIENLLSIQYNPEYLDSYLCSIGVLGSIAPIVNNHEITFKISQFLLTSIDSAVTGLKENKDETNYDIIFESLNLIFEIFGDKDYSYDYEIFVQQNYNQKLKELEPTIKHVYKKIDKNKNLPLKLKMEESWINLERFIKYKQSERS
ncbi:unnamed protein product [Candida verbasci]|uniref:SYO1-like TPR repeats domain-containing protein n=1 Tax=Candida verbasci TaxID=1227364 RepID=A0A9W4TRE0_9ASCO|nr:unnamed protein product [Candida verbasci]